MFKILAKIHNFENFLKFLKFEIPFDKTFIFIHSNLIFFEALVKPGQLGGLLIFGTSKLA